MTTRSLGAFVLSVLIQAPLAPLFGQDWPSFRGAGARGVADGENLPASWDVTSGRNVRWKVTIPGVGHASPVVWKDRLFLISAVGPEKPELLLGKRGGSDIAGDMTPHSWRIFCVDAREGTIRWEMEVYSGVPRAERHGKASYANQVHDLKTGELIHRERTAATHAASPVASDGHLYIASEDGEVLVYRTGREPELLARNAMGEPCLATPAIAGRTLFVRTARHLFAIGQTDTESD